MICRQNGKKGTLASELHAVLADCIDKIRVEKESSFEMVDNEDIGSMTPKRSIDELFTTSADDIKPTSLVATAEPPTSSSASVALSQNSSQRESRARDSAEPSLSVLEDTFSAMAVLSKELKFKHTISRE